MKRFLMFVGVAVVAAGMYVAASPASHQSSGPTAHQFNALKKQVASLSNKVNGLRATVSSQQTTIATLNSKLSALTTDEGSVKTTAAADHSFITTCLAGAGAAGVSPFGDPAGVSEGYLYQNSSGTFKTTALDVDKSSTPGAYFQTVAPSCVASGGALTKTGVPAEHRATTLAIKTR